MQLKQLQVALQYVLLQINEDQYQSQKLDALFWPINDSLTYIDPAKAVETSAKKRKSGVSSTLHSTGS